MKDVQKSGPFALVVWIILSCSVAVIYAQETSQQKLERGKSLYSDAITLSDKKTVDAYRIAIDKLIQASKLFHELENEQAEIDVYSQLGNIDEILSERGQYEDAIKAEREMLRIALDFGDLKAVRSILIRLAHENEELGKHSIALDYYQQAFSVNGELDIFDEYTIVNNIGVLCLRIGSLKKAEQSLTRAAELAKRIPSDVAKSLALANLGALYTRLKNNKKAASYFDEALPMLYALNPEIGAEQLQKLRTLATTTYYYGMVRRELGEVDKAITLHKEAVRLSRSIPNKKFEARSLCELGFDYLSLQQFELAALQFQQALQLSREVNVRDEQIASLDGLMRAFERLTKPELAILYGKQSINLLQTTPRDLSVSDKELLIDFVRDNESTYRGLAGILISEGRIAEAQGVLDLLKDEEYEQLSARRDGETAGTVPYSQSEQTVIKEVENLAALGRRRSEIEKVQQEKGGLSASKQEELDQVYSAIEKANHAFQKSLNALKTAEPSASEKIAEIESQQNLTSVLEDLRRETGAGAVALYTVIGTEETKGETNKTGVKFGWVVLVTPKESKAYPIDIEDLEETAFAFRMALSSAAYDPLPLAKKLYDKIFRQTSPKMKTTLEADLQGLLGGDKVPTIMWSLDGVLRYIPMAALHNGKQYLVEKFRHIVFTKQSLVGLSKSDKEGQVLGLGVSEAKTVNMQSFRALPGTERELKDIVRELGEATGILNGTRKMNREFTKDESIRLWRRGTYSVIHIASHFSFNQADQNASFLLVGDGPMSFGDLRANIGIFNKVDLLTLSACDTAMSSNGKESESFAWLAQTLGAKTVLASLWKVSDVETSELMIRFYRLRAGNPNLPKAEAFRKAQISLLEGDGKTEAGRTEVEKRSEPFDLSGKKITLPSYDPAGKPPLAHPHYWASFVLIGNWK